MLEYLLFAADSIEIPIGPVWELINKGGVGAILLLLFVALLKGWLVTPKRFEDNIALQERLLAAERAGRLEAQQEAKMWRNLALRQARILPEAVHGLEEAANLLEDASS